jgi:putative oxidoreductase
MTTTQSALASRPGTALLVVRLVLGATMLAHGYQKLFVFGFAGITAGFTQMGIPVPGLMGPFITLLELLGGIALIVGLLARLAALGLACDMLGAMAFVHFRNGFFLPTGFEFVFVLCGMAAAIALGGPGDLSVDSMLARRRSRADPLATE